jgi:hypothetical protein
LQWHLTTFFYKTELFSLINTELDFLKHQLLNSPIDCSADGCSHFNAQLIHEEVEMATSHGSKEGGESLQSQLQIGYISRIGIFVPLPSF